MKKFFKVLCAVFALSFAAGMVGCGSDSGSSGGDDAHCEDFDYPLYCPDAGVCCPRGNAFYCDGKCYEQDPGSCAQLDTCREE